LPPGCERLVTNPARTGSRTVTMTIGTVLVACSAARVATAERYQHMGLFPPLGIEAGRFVPTSLVDIGSIWSVPERNRPAVFARRHDPVRSNGNAKGVK
jgi:hypothetical protein